MTDPSQTPSTPPPSYSSAPPPAYAPPPPSNFPPMPRNAGAAFGMASGYFGATSPSTLAVHAIVLLLLGTLIGFINGFIGNAAASNVFSFIADIFNNLGLVVLVIAAARFVADAFRARG